MSKVAALVVAFVILVMAGSPASAFGLKTHLWIGQKIIEDLEPDCRLEIAGKQQDIDPDLCASILGNRGAFLAGVLLRVVRIHFAGVQLLPKLLVADVAQPVRPEADGQAKGNHGEQE